MLVSASISAAITLSSWSRLAKLTRSRGAPASSMPSSPARCSSSSRAASARRAAPSGSGVPAKRAASRTMASSLTAMPLMETIDAFDRRPLAAAHDLVRPRQVDQRGKAAPDVDEAREREDQEDGHAED